ncbi:MAG: DJ-1/PfpI family protein [Candidatus Altiarchaeum hamiconexum]|uniref:DJ-1/PfpI family protein n=1 Tax=Candidatus Altarchaeum hamiconexum TaxID=1803513 RepID=A0A8J7YWV0_9ARCH|nr:DJ-1/PfpI family protein [Candidatus Altarchaeum hamiconexum]OIQ04956.1 MAG: hypothetical protein AUK59_05710 [Candidatus Altarchaeum sp. CG2_30_32_3053]PIN66924.1 MAG: hypothetical protein COV98_05670 [Candidatus Altarchaeum sp. CG12_big_fil_rev_8_21_14_0_65_33_22]PIV28257.1 MAG: hypothetical protein COS36_02815 [Candidatus Altarchaeum sp. CG03_land_8_20_14_0_80_32_618]PIX49458.1 MAG: hypothetical protein COZ53_00575 [Candidatus Altarchaeum sp. CG_4_8_14_3_um_filter_33_2054]PIZ32406.1 MAG:
MTNEAKDLNVLYIVGDGFRPEEYFYSKEEVENGGFKVITAGKQKIVPARIIPGMPTSTNADITFNNIGFDKQEYCAVVVPGGSPGWENLYKNEKVMEILKNAQKKNLLIASICASPAVLAKAGILKGKKATIYPGMGEYLSSKGAIAVDVEERFENKTVIIKDKNFITGNGPWASRKFGKAIVEELNKKFKNNRQTIRQ